MPEERPSFVPGDAPWEAVTMRFNGIPILLYRTLCSQDQIKGWVSNPRIELVLSRWRRLQHRSVDSFPDDEEMLELMLEDDAISGSDQTFAVIELGEDVKRNGVRDPIIVTWEGQLLDGNRRKFAVMWALSERGGASADQRELLRRIPVLVLNRDADEAQKSAILVQENYAASLKKAWPEVITNAKLYQRYLEVSGQRPDSNDLQIRQLLREEFPRFGVTEIKGRIGTWQLIEEFRAELTGEIEEDELDRLINNQFQCFRQAHDTFSQKPDYHRPEFKNLLFQGIRHNLFPSFAAVRDLKDIVDSERATELFLQGEGMSKRQKQENFKRVRDEAGRDRAERELPTEARLGHFIDFLDRLTSAQIGRLSSDVLERLKNALTRVIAQAEASPSNNTSRN